MKEQLLRLVARRDLLREQVDRGKKSLTGLEHRHQDAQEAQAVIQEVGEAVQRLAHERVASVVTRCLEAIFGDRYTFKIDFVKRRGKTEADFCLVDEGEARDPLEDTSGGACDVVSFALRVAALVLTRPRKRQMLVLDEPMKMLSAGYRGRMADLMVELAEELGIQFLLITHHSEFQVGNVIRL